MPVISRLPNNKLIWNFKGKHKTMNGIYESLKILVIKKRWTAWQNILQIL